MSEVDPSLVRAEREILDEAKLDALMERLEEAGWVFGGGANPQTGEIGFGIIVDPESGVTFSVDELRLRLPVLDDAGQPLEGFTVDRDEDGVAFVEYQGILGESFERFVDAAVTLLNPSEPQPRDDLSWPWDSDE